jgi:hypothetical protein
MPETESAAQVLADLRVALNDATATHGFAVYGLRLVQIQSYEMQVPTFPGNPDPMMYVGSGDPNLPENAPLAGWPRSEALVRVAVNGPVETSLGHQWVVFMYALWEHEFRPRLAAAHGCDTDTLTFPLLGDLRLLRHDILHCRAIATTENTGRCEVIGHWFQPGEPIRIGQEHLREFFRLFPWDEMAIPPKA